MSPHATRTKIGSGALRNWRRRQATRLEPPTSLSEAERTVFIALVNSCGPTHFKASDMPLLSRYCEQTVLADLAAIHLREEGVVAGAKVSPWVTVQEKAIRGLVALSMRLRLSPKARLDPKTLSRQQTPVGVLSRGNCAPRICPVRRTMPPDDRKAKFFALMARYNRIGSLLPAEDDFDPHDAVALAETKVILAEMEKVRAELEAMMGLPT